MNSVFVDSETDGLYGRFLSIAAIVTDESGNEQDLFYGTIRNPGSLISSEWVKENVQPYLHDPVRSDDELYETEDELIEAFYLFFRRFHGCDVIADVPHPVESRLFLKIVERDPYNRMSVAPFPLMDLSSMLYAKGINPHIDRNSLVDCKDLRKHNALDDVRMGIRVWRKYIKTDSNTKERNI